MSECVHEAKWLMQWLSELNLDHLMAVPCTIYCDNTQAIRLAESGAVTERSKHFDLKRHICYYEKERGNVSYEYISSHDNISDIFTKVLPGAKAEPICLRLGLGHKKNLL